ncbi:MAG: hypothetical protein R3Y63_14585 [Eubacteriales bacterium]
MKINNTPLFALGVVMAVVGFYLIVQLPLVGFLVFPVGCLAMLFSHKLPEEPQEMSKIGNFVGSCYEFIIKRLDVIVTVFFEVLFAYGILFSVERSAMDKGIVLTWILLTALYSILKMGCNGQFAHAIRKEGTMIYWTFQGIFAYMLFFSVERTSIETTALISWVTCVILFVVASIFKKYKKLNSI